MIGAARGVDCEPASTTVSTGRGYVVDLPAYSGPFDLLLTLISRHQVDIYDIPLAAIVDGYLAEIERMETFDLDVASEFLLIAATLIELKTAALLPSRVDVDLDEELGLWEERDLLIARLLAAKTFRDASRALADRFDQASGFHPRSAGLDPELMYLCPDLLAHVSVDRLRDICERTLSGRPVPTVDLSHVPISRASVRDAMASVARRLPRKGTAHLRDLTVAARTRLDVIVVVLALLELFKQGFLDLRQGGTFGAIEATWLGPPDGNLPDWSGAGEWDAPDVTDPIDDDEDGNDE